MTIRPALGLLVMLTIAPSAALADHWENRAYPVQMGYKLMRGVGNVVTSPCEIPYNSVKEAQNVAEDSSSITEMVGGMVVGVFTGVAYMGARIGTGLWDIVTFPMVTEPLMYPPLAPSVAELALSGGREDY